MKQTDLNWKTLASSAQLEAVIQDSYNKPVALFKHSTRCGISFQAKERLEDNWDFEESEIDNYYLDLLNHRDISNEIASKLSVHHQSPQLILIKDGKVLHHASHHIINVEPIHTSLA